MAEIVYDTLKMRTIRKTADLKFMDGVLHQCWETISGDKHEIEWKPVPSETTGEIE